MSFTITQSHELPSIETISPNFTRVVVGSMVLWYSYQTIIAFKITGVPLAIQENHWGVTTGKHLNYISRDKSIRVGHKEFAVLMDEALKD